MSAALKSSALQASAQAFLQRFEGLRARLPGDVATRDAAASILRASGFPSARTEAWRYTSLRPLAEVEFNEPLTPIADCAELLARVPNLGAPKLVFVDGRFRDDLSDYPALAGVRVGGPSFGLQAKPERDALVALNTMLSEDGAEINVAKGVDAGTIVLISLGTAPQGRAVAFHPRHSVSLAKNAKLTLVEIAVGEGAYLHNPVMSVQVAAGAAITHLRIQNESSSAFVLSTLYADIAERGTYDSFTLALGGRLSRAEIHARLAGPDAIAHLNAAQLLGGSQHADFTTIVSHDAPNCASRQTVKTVLSGHSRGVFQGKIEVARAAQKTDGYQMNQALLLSPDAEMDSKPQLEIYADDVKCSHGATVGELDAEQLFYLRSRGVPVEQARMMLVRAFLNEALDPITHEAAREAMEAAIDLWWERQAA
jgi:Fe-S cluster assembly protein SufD